MSVKYILICVGLILLYHLISAQNTCHTRSTCQECIRDTSGCAWCAMNDFKGTIRCKAQSTNLTSWCPSSLQNPTNVDNPIENKNFSSKTNDVTQIKPQRYKLKLRPGQPQTFDFSFQGAKNFPVDLYFLLDASDSMKQIREMTATGSENIYLAIKSMTENVHLGLGTFIDKRVLPFTDNITDTELTYSFRHRLKLVDDFKKFKEVISKTPSGRNRDSQEGGLDALAQVMVCNITGWRTNSRKIIVLLTNGPYHTAGDGKSAGLFQPYDGKCYTNNNSYTKELEMDYPSVGMINKLAAERDIIIIFLVDSKVQYVYHTLSSVVSSSKVLTYNTVSDSTYIVKILKDMYEKISGKIKLKVSMPRHTPQYRITFKPDCTSDRSVSECNIEVGKERKIVGTATLLEYDGKDNAVIDVVVEGTGEKLTLEVDVIKDCECQKHVENNSTFCYGEKRVCGSCICSEKRDGERCACAKTDINTAKHSDNSTCIAEGSKYICSQHGTCICGKCQCIENFDGNFCEFYVDSCARGAISGEVCNKHGKCTFGVCKCEPDWSGEACDCYNSEADCQGRDGTICSNRGKCLCGVCQCNAIDEWDARNVQDSNCKVIDCPDCHELQCRKLETCAKCRRSGNPDCMSCDDRVKTMVVDTFTEKYWDDRVWNNCTNVKVEVGCYTNFVYRYNDTDYSIELVATTYEDCAKNYYWFGGIFLVTLLVVGLGTLIAWKLLTMAQDRQEYLKFEKQRQDAIGPSTNPLYEPPTTTFNNPAFRKKSVDFQ